ncbi:MAG: matrixin family metalloprotease, partial [Gammaproteobacteria bacterium]
MAAIASVTSSSDPYVSGLLGSYKWASGSLTYSFPTSYTQFEGSYGSGEPLNNFEALNATQQDVARAAFANFAAVANLTFTELTGADAANATLRLAESDAPSTAWAYMPHTAPEGGDTWFNNSNGWYDNPRQGNYAYTTFLHEMGHTLGLEHPHENGMPADGDSMEYSVMSYRAYVGAPLTGYPNETWGFAQSLMMYDIAAVQHLYGANFSTNSGNTTYS